MSELVPFHPQSDIGLTPYAGPDGPRLLALAFLAGYKGRTREAYETDLKQYGLWCDSVGIAILDVTRAHAQVYVRMLEDAGRASSTIARKLSAIAGYYDYCVSEQVLAKSPIAHVRRPKVSDESPRLGLDRGELGRLLATAHTAGAVPDALVCLLAFNGLRVSEACGATVEDLDEERGHRVLAVRRKGGKRARVALAPRTSAAIAALPSVLSCGNAAAEDGAAGPGWAGTAALLLGFDRFAAFRLIRSLARDAGITKTISPHSLRHTYVTLSLEAGVPLHEVQGGAGHADPRTTMRYDRARNSLARDPTYRLAAFVDVDDVS